MSAVTLQRLSRRPLSSSLSQLASSRSASTSTSHQAVVVGSGPAGVTAVGNLLDQGVEDVLFVDPKFQGGIFNERWRAVPSNTKVKTFIDWARGTQTFQSLLDKTASPNALDALQGLDGERECQLAYAADAVLLLQDQLKKDSRVTAFQGSLDAADQPQQHQVVSGPAPSLWNLSLSPSSSQTTSRQQSALAPLVVLATGASPKSLPAPQGVTPLPLEDVLDQSKLDKLGLDSANRVAVVGSSHSAVLALKFFYDRGIPTTNFYRNDLKYAVYKDGWILYDNTGLKGDASRWAKEMLENCTVPNIKRVPLNSKSQTEEQIYAEHLPACTHIVHAIGFEPHTIPINGHKTSSYDPITGQLAPGLFGTGIAFPERVTDPVGNVEYAVGLFKFMKAARRMVPEWIKDSGALQWR